MPVPKRWFHFSRDFNDDPEGWELTDTFGDRALRVWVEILSILDAHSNRFSWSPQQSARVARKVRQTSATVSRIVGWLLAKGWLAVGETLADCSQSVLMAPNHMKYNKTQEYKRKQKGVEVDPLLSYPNLSSPNSSSHPKKDSKKSIPLTPKVLSVEDFSVDDKMRAWAKDNQLPNPDNHVDEFKDHWRKTGGKLASGLPVKDWPATFRTWMRNTINPKFGRGAAPVKKRKYFTMPTTEEHP